MRTHVLVVAGSLLLSAPAVRAEPEPAAKAALEAMADAISKAKTLAYTVEIKGVGAFEAMLPVIKGELIAARAENSPAWKMRVIGRSEIGGAEPTQVLFVSDGTKKTWIDYPNKTVLEKAQSHQDLGPVGQTVSSMALREVFEAKPLSRERAAAAMKMEPQVELDGVMCDVVFVDPGENQTKSRYAIASTDRLPRRTEMIIEGAGFNGRTVATLTKVKVDAEPPEGSFAISTPEGFAFSPVFTPPVPNTTPTATPPAEPVKKDRPVGANLGDLAPDFDLATPSGEKIKLYGQRGYVVVLDFWGSWHAPCRRSTAEVQKIAAAYKDKPVRVYGLSVREGSDTAPAKFFKDNNLTYTLLLKGDEAAKAYRVRKYPMLFVLGKEGEIVYSVAGYDDKNAKDITEAIDKALAEGGKPRPGAAGAPGEDDRNKAKTDEDAESGKSSDGGK
jgi:peroxiredoxin